MFLSAMGFIYSSLTPPEVCFRESELIEGCSVSEELGNNVYSVDGRDPSHFSFFGSSCNFKDVCNDRSQLGLNRSCL